MKITSHTKCVVCLVAVPEDRKSDDVIELSFLQQYWSEKTKTKIVLGCHPHRKMRECLPDCSKMVEANLSKWNCGGPQSIKLTCRPELVQFLSDVQTGSTVRIT